MNLYRCYQCVSEESGKPLEFPAEKPLCPKCGADASKPHQRNIVIRLVVVHYHALAPEGMKGDVGHGCYLVIACDQQPMRGRRASADLPSVNCPACKRTKCFQDAWKENAASPLHGDFELTIDPEKGTLEVPEEIQNR